MTTNQIMQLDCRIEDNQMIIQRVLRLIKPLAKFPSDEDIELEAIEKAIRVMCVKYEMRIRSITTDVCSNDKSIIWRADLVLESNMKTSNSIYALSIYELMCKICIMMHSLVRTNKVELRRI